MKPFTAALCFLSALAWIGCSSPTSSKKTACACEKDKATTANTTIHGLDGNDSLVKAAKAAGKGVITGALQGEGKDVVKGLLKTATNAAGERRYLSTAPIPLSGATILIFDALRPTTAAETTITTDAKGNYSAVLKSGRYYGFAVHLDLTTFRLITASIPFISPKKDTIVKLDTAIAIEDVTSPTVTSVYDATSPDASGLFLVGAIPATGAKINIAFSEPIQRESIKGLVVGKVDEKNNSGSVQLKDSLSAAAVTVSWSGDNKQLTLSMGNLESGSRYGVVIPTSLKDLAKNPLEKEYRAVFQAVSGATIADQAFTVSSTYPADKETLKPTQNPLINFSRPPQIFSALNSIVIDPKVEGYWEVTGSKLSFVHKEPFQVGTTYTVGIPDTLVDLSGMKLDKVFRFGFTIKDYEGAAKDKKGREQSVALLMEDFFNSYLQGDIGKLGTLLDPAFRMEDGTQFLSQQQFLDKIRREVSEKNLLNAGFIAPVYRHDAVSCSTKVFLWKVTSADRKDTLWVQSNASPGILPKVFRLTKEITSGIAWSKTDPKFTLDGKEYTYDLPAAGGLENSTGDPRFEGERLRQTTTAVLNPVKDIIKDEFTIDGGISVTETEAKVAVKVSTIVVHGRTDWDPALACAEGAARDTSFRIVKFILGFTGTKWIVNHAVDAGTVEKQQFAQAVAAADFKVREIKPLNLLGPVGGIDGAGDATGKITLRFRGLDFDSVGGYLLGLAEDPKFTGGRPLFGGLYFLKSQGKGLEHRLILDAGAQVVSGGTSILRDVQAMGLPGWERVNFKNPLTELFNADKGLAGVYQWKVIAVRDTSASQFLGNGFLPDRFYGESDFGAARGSFAVKGYPKAADFNKLDQQAAPVASQSATDFTDRDLDGFPDYMEINYKTSPTDKGSFPNFLVDTDHDGLADFLEQMVDPNGIEVEATEAQKAEFFKALAAMGVKWTDTDGDGIPDDIEKLLGYNPNDATSKPATRARVSAPSGVYSGLIKLGDNSYPLKFKVRSQQDTLLVSYSAYLKDTLTDTVAASLNESMGEFLFPIRLPDNGPDSGKSLLLRGTYDKNRAFLQGTANRISSVPKMSTAFTSGPFVGQYAASGRGEDVSGYLGIQKTAPAGTVSAPVINTPVTGGTTTVTPALTAVMSYRKPPSGLGNAHMTLRQNGAKLYILTLIDEFGDTAAVLDSTHSYNQDDGSFDISARMTHTDVVKQYTRRIELNGRLGRGKDSLTDIWVLDGSMTESLDSCKKFDPANPLKCTDKLYRDVPGQFSARVNAGDASVKVFSNGVAGNFAGWLQQDKFGTGLSDGNTTTTPGGATNPGTVVTDPVPPESFAKPYAGTAAKFRIFLDQAGIGAGDAFYLTMRGRVMRTVNDTLHVKDGAFPYCGNVQILPTPIPLLDGATAQEKKDFSKDSILATSSKFAVLAIEDDLLPGTPAKVAKARDALGFVRTNVFLVESRYVDPSAFVGGKCLDGGTLPPIFPLDAGLPTLPAGYEYFRGDLEALRSALNAVGNKITVIKDGSTVTVVKEINPATLRIDPDTRAGMAADVSDPSLGYVLLGQKGKAGTPQMSNSLPAALAQ